MSNAQAQKLLNEFKKVHRREPRSREELESWFEAFAATPEGRAFIRDLDPMTDAEAADRYRLAQVRQIVKLFREANGHDPASTEELERWAGTPEGKAMLDTSRGPDGKIRPDIGDY
jgi:hypothetical protein